MKEIGKLERVPLKEVWKHEALEFTKWLEENIDVLNDVLDINLATAEREQSAGSFSVDLVAEDEAGDLVVIENQLGKSDHDHLGKLITYLTALEAKTAIWIVTDPRPEHVRAVSWLNESSAASFYLLKVEAVQIGDSPPAPLLTQIVGPSEESREVGAKKKQLAERDALRYRFWEQLLERARQRTKLHAGISPTHHSWISTGAGKTGLALNYVARQHETYVELYIDRGKDSEAENEAIFEQLLRHREAIESAFGEALEWQRLEGKRACRIKKALEIGGYLDEEKWPEVHQAMIDAMVRLEKALKPYISKLRI
ncbi:DUF4268 domain-containing protein [Candidatus Bipolaricaulota bacterium]|nr:DUF4268 domain-containing protein [Candidatus Bipolaricaulota bacterium]